VQHEDRVPESSPPPETDQPVAPQPEEPSAAPEKPQASPEVTPQADEAAVPAQAESAGVADEEAPSAPAQEGATLAGRGEIVEATIRRIAPFGAFVRLADGRKGLIHISQIAEEYVEEIKDHVKIGDVVRARITGVSEDGKVDLSIKKTKPRPKPQRPPKAKRQRRPDEAHADTAWLKPNKEIQVNPLADLLRDVEKNVK